MQTAASTAGPAGQAWPLVAQQAHWRTVDFISDLHLDARMPLTWRGWQDYMRCTTAQAVFILGDLFEVWVGDDVAGPIAAAPSDADSFELRCARTLRQAADRLDVFFMCGNRDFLVGEAFARACDMQWLRDPCVLDFAGERWLLSHGDALCLADTDYQRFRALVRGAPWQRDFLDQPLAQRKAAARALREQSEQRKRAHPVLVDVDAQAAAAWLREAGARRLIHGHTHHAADHALGGGLQRIVLSDWDLHATPPRAQVLRLALDPDGGPASVRRLSVQAAC